MKNETEENRREKKRILLKWNNSNLWCMKMPIHFVHLLFFIFSSFFEMFFFTLFTFKKKKVKKENFIFIFTKQTTKSSRLWEGTALNNTSQKQNPS